MRGEIVLGELLLFVKSLDNMAKQLEDSPNSFYRSAKESTARMKAYLNEYGFLPESHNA